MEREEEEVEPEQRVEKKHGQEEKQKEVLQALGQGILPQPLLEAAGHVTTPQGMLQPAQSPHRYRGEVEEEGAAEQSCGGTDRYRPSPLHLSRCGDVEDSCVKEGIWARGRGRGSGAFVSHHPSLSKMCNDSKQLPPRLFCFASGERAPCPCLDP